MQDAAAASQAPAEPWLRSRSWDRIFIVGGALLVPLPILLFYVCQWLGMSVGTCEDIVTLFVMVLVGAPHAFATFTRTLLNPEFVKREAGWAIAGLGMVVLVVTFAIMSAFYGVTWLGFPPIYFLMTGFFFWAGMHIVQQASFCARCYGRRGAPTRAQKLWGSVDYLLMFGCLYPMSFFRMSMIDPAAPRTANPDALATQIVVGLTGSQQAANDYVFRIGRVEPVLPEFARSDAWWILIAVSVALAAALFAFKSWREWRAGVLNVPRFQLVATTAVVGVLVPVFPNLDSSFQGFNMWHSFQYLGLLWLMHVRAHERGERLPAIARRFVGPGGHRRFYGLAIGVTFGLIAAIASVAWLIQVWSGGHFVVLGVDPSTLPVDAATGRPIYRPGALLLAYYLIGFGFLLAHYLHDALLLSRPRLMEARA